MNKRLVLALAGLAAPALTLSCSGGGKSAPSSVTVHLTASGVSSTSIKVLKGGTVIFVNEDIAPHQIASDPHPGHTACPELNQPAPMTEGSSFTATMNAVTLETCGFHDEQAPTATSFQGTVTTSAPSSGGGTWVVAASGAIAAGDGSTFAQTGSPTTRELTSLFCIERNGVYGEGWAVGAHGTILHKPDQGAWATQASWTDARLLAVAFADWRFGIAAGENGVILRTIDGGDHWTAIAPAPMRATLRAADFSTDGRHAWISGDAGTLLVSNDAGASFTRVSSATTANLRAIRFASDARHGFAVGDGGVVVATLDGGATWSVRAHAPATLRGLSVSGDGTRVIAAGDAGLVWRSIDRGASWQPIASGSTAELRAAGFAADSHEGWIAGAAGTILHTTDDGAHWATLQSPIAADLNSLEDQR